MKAVIDRYSETDPGMKITVSACDLETEAMDDESTANVLNALYSLPEGVQRMSEDVEGLVQTSLNMGILETAKDCVKMSYCVRSSVDSEKEELLEIMKAVPMKETGMCQEITLRQSR